ncbi:hypothetical protein HZF05_08585 [Sphingomonas sp. CGMCC 1.13654]|uniref:Uncharacterized protein n=1 Tax=Sphingomonas chungangi TaxID=2683589 RepID=A0A838L623_9SPHN|nr:hypothetical protein [Sphingomonas chungangi]MBA2934155.1 hypothetical protein [Sphingomonas chungangi]MVW57196.1 hypothetical protein [Sphingomonas chungangi]
MTFALLLLVQTASANIVTLSPPAPVLPKAAPPSPPIVVTAPPMLTLSPPAPVLPSWEETLVAQLRSDDRAVRERAIEAALAAPYALHPLTGYPPLVGALWADGRRTQATFWFYVFQERSAAWALADDEGRGSGAAALRTAMNDQLGQAINPWVASDVSAWKRIAARAVSYEAKFPLYARRPEAMTQHDWLATVDRARATYRDQLKQLQDVDAAGIADSRKQRGLPTGSLDDPGPDLPDGWQ